MGYGIPHDVVIGLVMGLLEEVQLLIEIERSHRADVGALYHRRISYIL